MNANTILVHSLQIIFQHNFTFAFILRLISHLYATNKRLSCKHHWLTHAYKYTMHLTEEHLIIVRLFSSWIVK